MVRHDAQVADERPHSRVFSDEVRKEVGLAIKRAREGAGHPFRPSFVVVAGSPLGRRSLLKLESGVPVGAPVYEAAGRTLGLYYEDWGRDTPLAMFRGAPEPPGILKNRATPRAEEDSAVDEAGESADDFGIDGGVTDDQDPDGEPAPDPANFADLEAYFRATIRHLIGLGLPRDAILRAANDVIEHESLRRKSTEGNSPTASGNGGGTSG